jgi:subtilisin family serine protease
MNRRHRPLAAVIGALAASAVCMSTGTASAEEATSGDVQFTYGIECRQSQMGRNGTCPSRDTNGHGTHVAGIAAGDGSGFHRGSATYEYPGVAPEADLIVVRTTLSGRSVVDGVAYIFSRAHQLGKAAVVNLSLGSPQGYCPEHFDTAFRSAQARGVVVVAPWSPMAAAPTRACVPKATPRASRWPS